MDPSVFRKSQKRRFQTFSIPGSKRPDPEGMYSDLSPSVRLLIITGIFPMWCEKKGRPCRFFFIQVVAALLHLYWSYVFCISFMSAICLSRQFKTNFTLSLGNALVAGIRFAAYRNARRVRDVAHAVQEFSGCVPGAPYRSIACTVRVLCCLGSLSAVGMTLLSAEHLKLSGMFASFSRDFVLGLNDSSSTSFLHHFPAAIFVSTVFYHHFVPIVLCVHVCSVFHILRKSVRKFGDSVRPEGDVDVRLCLSRFIRMMDAASQVEDLLGSTLFFSFGCLLINQLCVMNSVIVGHRASAQLVSVAMEFMLSVKNVAIFSALTLSGAAVTKEMEAVRSRIRRLVLVPSSSFEALSLLLQHVDHSRVSLTVWNIFTLKRSLFLTTASVLTSYGMLLMQLSQQDKIASQIEPRIAA